MPLYWRVYQNEDWAQHDLLRLASWPFAEEAAYMQWLGEEQQVYGI